MKKVMVLGGLVGALGLAWAAVDLGMKPGKAPEPSKTTTEVRYDGLGRIVEIREPVGPRSWADEFPLEASADLASKTVTYDERGNIVRVVESCGTPHPLRIGSGGRGQPVRPDGTVVTYEYSDGCTFRDDGHRYAYTYDGLN